MRGNELMRIVVMGCVQFSRDALKTLSVVRGVEVVGVATRRASAANADFCDLSPLAKRIGASVFFADKSSPELINPWLQSLRPDYLFCLGWSRLLKKETLRIPAKGCIGYHPAKLPDHRGRHPLVWALALGLRETESTFFYMDERADGGRVIARAKIRIAPDDDAASLYKKMTRQAVLQLRTLSYRLVQGRLRGDPQNEAKAGSWRKRSQKDGQIDWRMSSEGVHNLVRALAKPYPGAECWHAGRWAKVWKSKPAPAAHAGVEPGKILKRTGRKILVKCGHHALWLLRHELSPLPKEGSYL